MLTYRQHVETTLKCKKSLSVLKAMAAKGIGQRRFFLLYQSEVLILLTIYGLTAMALSNLLDMDRVQRGTFDSTCTRMAPHTETETAYRYSPQPTP